MYGTMMILVDEVIRGQFGIQGRSIHLGRKQNRTKCYLRAPNEYMIVNAGFLKILALPASDQSTALSQSPLSVFSKSIPQKDISQAID